MYADFGHLSIYIYLYTYTHEHTHTYTYIFFVTMNIYNFPEVDFTLFRASKPMVKRLFIEAMHD